LAPIAKAKREESRLARAAAKPEDAPQALSMLLAAEPESEARFEKYRHSDSRQVAAFVQELQFMHAGGSRAKVVYEDAKTGDLEQLADVFDQAYQAHVLGSNNQM